MGARLRALGTVAAVALATRLAATDPLVAAWGVGLVAATAAAVGFALHAGRHDRQWRRGWLAIVASTVAVAVSGIQQVTPGSRVEVAAAWAVAGGALFALGAAGLLRHRLPRGRVVEVVTEAAVGASGVAFVVWGLLLLSPGQALPATEPFHFTLPLISAFGLWLVVRLVLLTDDRPRSYWYLLGAALITLTAHAVPLGTLFRVEHLSIVDSGALVLWSLCLIASASLHPATADSFDPVPPRPSVLGWGRIVFVVTSLLLGPAVITWHVGSGETSLGLILLGVTVIPLLIVVYLVWQIQERASAEYRAQHDGLTGLPNRVLFSDRIEMALANARRNGNSLGVMFIDLDRFKQINDSLGHDVGDALLRGVARRLRQHLREQDTVGRLGGDEFTVLLTEVGGREDCLVVARKVLTAFERPFRADGHELAISPSIGLAVFPEDGEDVETLLQNADTAMYRVKARGRNGVQPYTTEMSTRAQVRLAVESGLRAAMERSQLSLHYQPRVNQVTGQIVGVEALARWKHPELGYIPPDVFVEVAEDSGLISRLGDWALDTAGQQLQQWREEGLLDVPVAVNVSARQLGDPEHLEHSVADLLRRTGLPPQRLELELTESVLVPDSQRVPEILCRLRGLGVRTAIDDFGTGYSGLLYLTTMPIDTLKIDRGFVATIMDEADHAPVVDAVIALAHSLDLTVVAEGVETEAQASFLRTRGCQEAQGYLFSRPISAEQLEETLRFARSERMAPREILSSMVAVGSVGVASATGPADQGAIIEVLRSVKSMDDPARVDPEILSTVLAALLPRTTDLSRLSTNNVSVRLALGTFAGLLPISTGLAAAGALPPVAQDVMTQVYRGAGLDLAPADSEPAPTILAFASGDERVAPTVGRSEPAAPPAPARDGGRGGPVPPVDPSESDPETVVALPAPSPDSRSQAPTPPQPSTPPAETPVGRGPSVPGNTKPPGTPVDPTPPAPGKPDVQPGKPDTPAEPETPPGRPDTPPPGKPDTPPGKPDAPGKPDTPPGKPDAPPGKPDDPGPPDEPPGKPDEPPGKPDNPGPPEEPPGKPDNPGPPEEPPGKPDNPGPPEEPPGKPDEPPGKPDNPGPPDEPPGRPDNPGNSDEAPGQDRRP